tara:strand:- start:10493 stop:11248 length:756 start_codon:yes stop_codon:yes gene_type:complete
MKICKSLEDLRQAKKLIHGKHGFVPTMGALHAGHFSLVKKAREENDFVSVSIFVNPTQFNQASDLENYPSSLEEDLAALKDLGVDLVFLPDFSTLYPDEYRFKISENDFSKKLCGHHRPGHFDGVLTVVIKLFHLMGAERAYFGEKDFQQLSLIRGMVEAFFMPIEIIAVPTVRETTGLALSSRNSRLSPEARDKASLLYEKLRSKSSDQQVLADLQKAGFDVDYVETIENRRFVAASIEGVRLIDNEVLP